MCNRTPLSRSELVGGDHLLADFACAASKSGVKLNDQQALFV